MSSRPNTPSIGCDKYRQGDAGGERGAPYPVTVHLFWHADGPAPGQPDLLPECGPNAATFVSHSIPIDR